MMNLFKIVSKFLIVSALFLSINSNADYGPKEITLGFSPGGNRDSMKKGAFAVAKALQKELGIPVNVFLPKSYSSLGKAIQEKRVDFAFLTALTFVNLEKESKIKVLLKKVWVEPFYFSSLIVPLDSKIKKLEQLKGARIAFVDKKSASGYLYPQVMFKKKSILESQFKEIIFSGSHDESIRLLEKGAVDVAAVFADDKEGKLTAWNKFAKEKKSVRSIWTSEPIPNDPFCVRQDFYEQHPKFVHSLMFNLIDVFDQLKAQKEVQEVLGARTLVPATAKQYDPVREMVKELKPNAE